MFKSDSGRNCISPPLFLNVIGKLHSKVISKKQMCVACRAWQIDSISKQSIDFMYIGYLGSETMIIPEHHDEMIQF